MALPWELLSMSAAYANIFMGQLEERSLVETLLDIESILMTSL